MDKTVVIWVRCGDAQDSALWRTLERELCQDGDDFSVLATDPRSSAGNPKGERAVQAFIAEHAISVVIWYGGPLDPTTLKACLIAKISIILLDGSANSVPPIGLGLLPARRRSMFAKLDAALVCNDDNRAALQKAGAPSGALINTGPFETTAEILPHDEDDRHKIAHALSVRPIWLAANIDEGEAPAVWDAYKHAARSAHRLLLIVVPAGNPDAVCAFFRSQATSITIETDGHLPRESTQAFLANGEEKMGLWYRLAPITYIGGSLTSGARSDPYHAAALGSAIVHGPKLAEHHSNFDKLIAAHATLQIDQADKLGDAVATLLSADKAAKMVASGWDITSRGVEAMAQLATTIQQISDRRRD